MDLKESIELISYISIIIFQSIILVISLAQRRNFKAQIARNQEWLKQMEHIKLQLKSVSSKSIPGDSDENPSH